MKRRLAYVGMAVLAATMPREARAQSAILLQVVDSATRQPVPNAEIAALGRRGLTDAHGEMRVAWPDSGALHVRVRQIGFRYVERDLRRDPASRADEDTVVVALGRLRWALPQVVVRAEQKCRDIDPRDAPLSQASMELLRFGAEQFENFRRSYPFDLSLERTTSDIGAGGRTFPRAAPDTERTSSVRWGDRYVPGKVVEQVKVNDYFVPLLFVSALADTAFWERHCFVARGVETLDGRRVIRLRFYPARDVREPEWEGSAWLDSARSVLARVDFRLTNLHDRVGPQEFTGYTVFSTPSPFIAMPDSTVAQWTTALRGSYGQLIRSIGQQSYVIRDVRYAGRVPPRP